MGSDEQGWTLGTGERARSGACVLAPYVCSTVSGMNVRHVNRGMARKGPMDATRFVGTGKRWNRRGAKTHKGKVKK